MILRKLIGWCIVFGSLFIGLRGLDLSAYGAESIALVQARNAPAQLRLNHWAANGWIVEQSGRDFEVRFPGLDAQIDTTVGLFGTLARRVAEVSGERRGKDTILSLRLSCSCSIAVTGQGGQAVVIDVIDPASQTLAGSGPAPRTAPMPVRRGGKPTEAPADNAPLDVDEARKRLMEQLLRAADAGLVDLKPDPNAPKTLLPSGGETMADAMDAEDPEEMLPAEPEAAVSKDEPKEQSELQPESEKLTEPTTDPAERDQVAKVHEQPKPKAQCFADEAFLLPDSMGETGFTERLAALQADLLGEFDTIDAEAAIDLVRLYLSLAMTEEARLVMETFVPLHPLTPLYGEIADLLDAKPLSQNASLRLVDCGGDQRLWRAMTAAVDGDGKSAVKDEIAADRAMERLPVSIRDIVGSTIGLAAADVGAWDAARRLEAMVARSQSSDYGDTALELLLSARIADWHGEADRANAMLKRARSQAGADGDTALLRLAEADLSEAALGLDTRALRHDLGSIAMLERGTPKGHRAFELEVQFLDLAEGRDAAVDLLAHGVRTGLYPDDAFAGLVSRLVEGSLYNELSRPLAFIYLDQPERYREALDRMGFRKALIRSLIDTGLATTGYGLLRPDDMGDPELIEAVASAVLDANALTDAEGLLERMPEGPMRNRFGAQVMLALGQPDRAVDRLASAAQDWVASAEDQIEVLDIEIAAALAKDDYETALDAMDARLGLLPDAAIAQQSALIALESGAAGIPAKAREVLSEAAPEILSDLEILFKAAVPADAVADAETATVMIETLESELSLIEEILNDG